MINKKIGIIIQLIIFFFVGGNSVVGQSKATTHIDVSTNFSGGGGEVKVISSKPPIIRFRPHNEGDGQWGQVWFYFKIKGLQPGEEITLQFENPKVGISPQISFSYDQRTWGLTNTGEFTEINGEKFFIYKHVVKSDKVWFSYDLPYRAEQEERLLLSIAGKLPGVEVFELCKTRKNRPVMALRINDKSSDSNKKYGIWLQARTHAFEAGSSWVLDGLTRWLLSNDSAAKALRSCSIITVVPIVDIDGVVEGRTGKNQVPFDFNRGWDKEPSFWNQTSASKTQITKMKDKKLLDMYIDFHGPGNLFHPYFIVPFSKDLPSKQQQNREKFFEILNARPMNDEAKKGQSMTEFYYSERSFSNDQKGSSANWVTTKTNDHIISLSLEVNMSTPFSTRSGYQAEGIELGNAISNYFIYGYHQK